MQNYFVYVEDVEKQIHIIKKTNTWYGMIFISRQEWENQGGE